MVQIYNHTDVEDFLLLGFSIVGQRRFSLFIVLLIIYITTITSNIFIIAIIKADRRLHKPMYFFIAGLSFLELWYPSVTVPRLLWSLKTGDEHISLVACIAQFYLHFSLGAAEMFLLTAMGYDRYVAICHPLRYLIIMSPNVCAVLIVVSWVSGFVAWIGPVLKISTFWFCNDNKIDHYYCDFTPIIRLSCSDTSKAENFFFFNVCFITLGCFLMTLISYAYITRMIIKLSSALARLKTFSTFASHLFVVTLFYGTIMFMFIRPPSGDSLHFNKMVSVVPSVVTPLLNPIIYTLRNQEVIQAMLKAAQKVVAFITCK